MTEKRFKLIGDSNLEFIMQDKIELPIYDYNNNSKRLSLMNTLNLLNQLSDENEQLKHDATVLIQANQDYRRENDKIKSLLLKKIKDLNNDYEQSARMGMPTGGIIGELDSFEEICEIMGWKND